MKANKLFKKIDKEKDVVSIEKFIVNYLNDGDDIYLGKIAHNDLKKLVQEFIVNVSYDFVDANFDLFKRGFILIVKDDYGKLIPYLNPCELKKIKKLESLERAIIALRKEKIYELKSILSSWVELEMLMMQKEEIYQVIELLRQLNKKEYLERINIDMEGEEKNDKYKRRSRIKCFKS